MARVSSVMPPKFGGINTPSEPVLITLGDGKERVLRYGIKSLKMLRDLGIVRPYSDPDIAQLIFVGLHNEKGEPPADVTLEDIEGLETTWVQYLGSCFNLAYNGSLPPEKKEIEKTTAPQEPS